MFLVSVFVYSRNISLLSWLFIDLPYYPPFWFLSLFRKHTCITHLSQSFQLTAEEPVDKTVTTEGNRAIRLSGEGFEFDQK